MECAKKNVSIYDLIPEYLEQITEQFNIVKYVRHFLYYKNYIKPEIPGYILK